MLQSSRQTIAQLQTGTEGEVLLPGEPEYSEATNIWNGMIDRHPAVIVKATTDTDIPPAIQFAQENELSIAVLGGGHHIAGNSLCDDGLVIDLSQMNKIEIDPENKRAYVEAGARLADLDKASQEHGLATPTGINSTTGISGLTLGGGFGWLTRKYGLTIDNLLSADVITPDIIKVHASEKENKDLFWALRGGGGNFGIVTKFEFQLHPVGPEVLAGLLVFPFNQIEQILTQYRNYVFTTPREFNAWIVVRSAPPLPFLPEEVHGEMVAVVPVFYAGDPTEGQNYIETIKSFGDLYGEHVVVQSYVEWQQIFDPLLTSGARNYWKSHNFKEFSDPVIQQITKFGNTMPSEQCEIFIALVEGKMNEIPADATAYSGRDAKIIMNVHSRWDHPEDDDTCINWARSFFQAISDYASSGAYTNFMTEDESERIPSAYGSNFSRLKQLKQKYDPENLLHVNHNIKPTVSK